MRAGGEIDLLDFYPDFLSESFRSFAPLGRLFEIANAWSVQSSVNMNVAMVFLR